MVAATDALHVHAAALGGQVRGHDEPPLGAAQLAGQVDDGAVEAPGVGLPRKRYSQFRFQSEARGTSKNLAVRGYLIGPNFGERVVGAVGPPRGDVDPGLLGGGQVD